MGRIEELAGRYRGHIVAPWQRNLAGDQKAIFVVYPKTDERKLRARLEMFEMATTSTGHRWQSLDLTDTFARWMTRLDYPDRFFNGPRRLAMLLDKAGEKQGWFSIKVMLYGRLETKQVKLFKATYRPAGGQVLVLIVREAIDRWRAYMCTNLSASAQQILQAVSDRMAIEQNFHDLKEIEGAGQQQVRNYFTNVGVFHLNMWVHTLVELWAWSQKTSAVCDRSDSPWDSQFRRPSHADKCISFRLHVLKKAFFETFGHSRRNRKIARQFYKLMKLAA